jgi:cytochrome d ubiquinol oxidase subunit II
VQGAFGWFSPFAVMTAIAVVFGYALLGATWLILKTEGRLQRIAFDLTRPLMLAVIGFMLMVSAWLPFLDSQLMERWFTGAHMLWLSPVPILTVVNAILLWRAVLKNREVQPFVLALCFFALGFVGLVVGMWPNIVPPSMSIWEAASPPSSQGFVLVGAAFLIPAVLAYTVYSYRVFRGKVLAGEGYH